MSQDESDSADQIITISYKELPADTLRGVIESFVLQEGTDYGDYNYTLDQKVSQVEKLLQSGQAIIVFDKRDETCNIRTKNGPF